MNIDSRYSLRGLVVLAIAGSFLVPPELFLQINFARTEIMELESKRDDLRLKLANEQENRHANERTLLRAKSEAEERRNALIELARQQSSLVVSPELLSLDMEAELARAKQRLAEHYSQKQAMHDALVGHDEVKLRLDTSQIKFNQSENLISSFEEELRVVTGRLHDITRQSNNQYHAMRAVSLGALGALAAALAAFLPGAKTKTRLNHAHTMLSMVFSGIVALVVFALFTTRELSVFVNVGPTPDEIPDYWRVVIVCLIAGAFADRLFVAARERVYQATRGQDESSDTAAPSQGDTGDATKT